MPGGSVPQLGRVAAAAPARAGATANPRGGKSGVGAMPRGWRGAGGSRVGVWGLGFASQALRDTKAQVKAPVNPDFNPL